MGINKFMMEYPLIFAVCFFLVLLCIDSVLRSASEVGKARAAVQLEMVKQGCIQMKESER